MIWLCGLLTNRYLGKHINSYIGDHGRYSVSQLNVDVRMLLEYCLDKLSCVSDAWFKREENTNVIFRL